MDKILSNNLVVFFQKKIQWEKSKTDDPELYVAYFNYYVMKSMTEQITIGNNPKGENVLQIMDRDSTKKEPVGYIYGDTYYNTKLLNNGFDYISNRNYLMSQFFGTME